MTTQRQRRTFGTARQLSSGLWQARYPAPDGTRRSAGTHSTEREALQALAAVETDLARGTWKDERAGDVLFSTVAREVMRQRRGELAPRTHEGYQLLLTKHILPTFGHLTLNAITIRMVDQWWANMGAHPVNRRNAYGVLSNVFRYAVRWEHIAKSPCRVEKASKKAAKPRPYMSVEQFVQIVAATPDNLHTPLWTAFGGSLRVGELVGLNRGDYDMETGVLTVTRQVAAGPHGARIAQTKNGQSKSVTLLKPAQDALREYIAASAMLPTAPLFVGLSGQRLGRGYVQREWKKAADSVGLSGLHVHDCRATSLTLMAQGGASIAELMAKGGHVTAAAAMVYQHAALDRDKVVTAKADAILEEHLLQTVVQ